MTTEPITLAEYARRKGVSREAVSQAVKKGRLSKSVGELRGRPAIADPDLADKEWAATTDFTKAPTSVKLRASAERGLDGAEYDLANEAAREKHWKANLAQLEFEVKSGELVPVAEVEAKFMSAATAAKTKLLGVATRVRQRLPHLAAEDVATIHALIREALEDLADGG